MGTRTGIRALILIGAMGLLLVACDSIDSAMESITDGEAGTSDEADSDQDDGADPEPVANEDEGSADEGAGDADPDASDDQQDGASPEAEDDDGSEDASDDDGSTNDGATDDASDDDLAGTLQAAVERANTAIDADTDVFDDRCDDLAEWDAVRAATNELPDPDNYGDAGHLSMMEELHFFGCGFARYQTDDGFQYPGVIVSVNEIETDLPSGFEATDTPAGRSVLLGVGAITAMDSFGEEEVGNAVLRAGGVELHVSSPEEIVALDDLLPLVDAAVTDLAAAE